MVVLLALGSALAYGLSDFVAGLLSRRTGVWSVAVVGQVTSTLCTTLVAWRVPGDPVAVDWVWGAVAGGGSGVGTVFLYRGLARGRMGVVAPLSAVGAALVPVLVGLVAGERPDALTWLGVACAFPAIWLISRSPSGAGCTVRRASGVVDGIVAGLGFGVLFAALGQVPDSAGLGPLALTQGASVVVIVAIAIVAGGDWRPRDRFAALGATAGLLGAAATGLFLLATHAGLLIIAAVLSALYPATTVLLAAGLLHERIHRAQGWGLLLAATAVGLVAAG